MKEMRRNDIHLDPYQKLDLGPVATTVGSATEQVTVEATTPLVETADRRSLERHRFQVSYRNEPEWTRLSIAGENASGRHLQRLE